MNDILERSPTLIRAKHSLPSSLSPSTIKRSKLEKRLIAAKERLVFLCAPAGYGKTALIREYCSSHIERENIAWYTVDSFDDSLNFSRYILNSLQPFLPADRLPKYLDVLKQEAHSLEPIICEIIRDMELCQKRITLVVDDYHHVSCPIIHSAMQYFARYLPANMTLIVISRSEPPIALKKLSLDRAILKLTAEELNFSAEEKLLFFQRKFDRRITTKEKIALEKSICGWAAGLEILSQTPQAREKFVEKTEQFSESNEGIYRYFMEEVFLYMDSDTQKFALDIAILDSFTSDIAQRVTLSETTNEHIERLARNGLIKSSKHDYASEFKFHMLFLKFLRRHTFSTQPHKAKSLNQRAATAYYEKDNAKQALHHAIHCDDKDLIHALLKEHGWTLWQHDQKGLIQDAFEQIPDKAIWEDLNLTLFRAWSLARSKSLDYTCKNTIETLLEKAEQHQKTYGDSHESAGISKTFETIRAFIALKTEDRYAHDQHWKKAEVIKSDCLFGQHAEFEQLFAEAEINLEKCEFSQGLVVCKKALSKGAFDRQNVLKIHNLISETFYLRGDWDCASRSHLELIDFSIAHAIEKSIFIRKLYTQRCEYLIDIGETEQAKAFIERAENPFGKPDIEIDHTLSTLKLRLSLTDEKYRSSQIRPIELSRKLALSIESNGISLTNRAKTCLTLASYWHKNLSLVELLSHLSFFSSHANTASVNGAYFSICECVCLYAAEDYAGASLKLNILLESQPGKSIANIRHRAQFLLAACCLELGKEKLATSLSRRLIQESGRLSAFSPFSENPALTQKILAHYMDECATSANTIERIHAQKLHKIAFSDEKEHAVAKQLEENVKLTPKEREVLHYISAGLSNDEIAKNMLISISTVKWHIKQMYRKLGIRTRNEARSIAHKLLDGE